MASSCSAICPESGVAGNRRKGASTSVLNFFYPVLDALSDGRIIRKTVIWVLRVLGVLVFAGGLLAVFALLRFAFQFAENGTQGAGTLAGGLLFALILLAGVAAITQIHFYRATSVEALGESGYTVLSIVSILFRTAGEIYATLGVVVGVGGCLFMWLARFNPLQMLGGFGTLLPAVRAENTMVGGLFFLIYLAVSSFTFLMLSYFLAELTLVVVEIARNLRNQAHAGPEPAGRRCPSCALANQLAARFCTHCGTRLTT